jgi:hypothetical protein
LVNIGRNGEQGPKTKAEVTPQISGGLFRQPECLKLNNNKEAQNGGWFWCDFTVQNLRKLKVDNSTIIR